MSETRTIELTEENVLRAAAEQGYVLVPMSSIADLLYRAASVRELFESLAKGAAPQTTNDCQLKDHNLGTTLDRITNAAWEAFLHGAWPSIVDSSSRHVNQTIVAALSRKLMERIADLGIEPARQLGKRARCIALDRLKDELTDGQIQGSIEFVDWWQAYREAITPAPPTSVDVSALFPAPPEQALEPTTTNAEVLPGNDDGHTP